MRIKSIAIRNFRGIQTLPPLGVGSLNTFVGKNDSGKSAILRALDCFFNEKNFDANKDIYKGAGENEAVEIELSFIPPQTIDDLAIDETGHITLKKVYRKDKDKTKIKTYYLSYDFVDPVYQNLWNKKEADLNELIGGLGATAKKSGRGNKNLLRIEHVKKLLGTAERKEVYHELGDFLDNIEKAFKVSLPEYSLFDADQDLDVGATAFQAQFKTLVSNSFDSNKTKTDELEDDIKSELAKEFEEIKTYMSKNVSGLEKLTPVLESDWKKSIKFDLSMTFEGENYEVPISHKGTGFKRLLMVAYFEYLAKKKQVVNQIFAIEEPETFLHPSAQADLLNSIIEISSKSQFFISTHSPVFAGASNGESSILVTKTSSGLSEYSCGEHIIERIITELGIKPDYNLLENAKYLLFVEGVDDALFLKHSAKTILGKDLDADGILCVPGGGSSLKNFVDLGLFKKLASGRNNKYGVLVDGDNSDPTKEKALDKIKSHCQTDSALFARWAKREIENYCHPEAIKRCYINICGGPQSQNPNIPTISGLQIVITDTADVDDYLKGLGLANFKDNHRNVSVFEQMTLQEWEAMDGDKEISILINSIYSLLNQPATLL